VADAPSAPADPVGGLSQAATAAPTVDPNRELFITDLSVVEDPDLTSYVPDAGKGAWSFGRLIENMQPAGQRNRSGASRAVLNLLATWESNQTVNSFTIPSRPLIRSLVIDPWKQVSGCAGADSDCLLDFTRAPFRLLAIVNRPDLRRLPGATNPGMAGQGRFVFGVLDAAGAPLPFTVILEYMLPIPSTDAIKTWAEAWHHLGALSFGPSFNSFLALITAQFAGPDRVPTRPNGSALLQLRTNEVPLTPNGGRLWELREFIMQPDGLFKNDTVKQEPDFPTFNNSSTLASYVNQNLAAVAAGTHDVPATFAGVPFLAAAAIATSANVWRIPGVAEDIRHSFALSTCSGCHRTETGTAFLHVGTRLPGVAALPSAFLAAELAGPRKTDFATLLAASKDKIKDGKGKDKGHNGID
jgi:cytochrome c553